MLTFRKIAAGLAATAALLFAQAGHAADGIIDSASFEFGTNPKQRMARVAVQSDWDQRWFATNGRHLSGYWEGSLAWWRLDAYRNVPGQRKNLAVIGFTPVLRYQNDSKLGLYGEIGIGVNLFSKLYKNEDNELSTAFQFGDHIGVGYTTARWDFGLRFQHYSNASIKKPNDGANWIVAKAAYRF
ncbi:acyloxyacyl hydrolase [Massilia consociata]|uniref:Lipid A deacylase n=1 Tax=Massilia consociata TaxID=760117 RepID=A0ABV6FKM8_9BURK